MPQAFAFVSNLLVGVSCFTTDFCSGVKPSLTTGTTTSLCVHRPELQSPNIKPVLKQIPVCLSNVPSKQSPSKLDRQSFLRIATITALSSISLSHCVLADPEFATYKGPISLGFSFSYPTSWTVTKKAIKTHLSEVIVSSKDDSATNVGLVVDTVKIDTIDKFGTPQTIGQKVVDVENKKDSVNNASVQSATSVTKDGLTYYLIDYTVDSSRGLKRYVAKATVTGSQLYVFTAQAKVDNFQGETEEILSKMLDSFSVVKQYA